MKAFVAVVASLCASAKAQVYLNPYQTGYTGLPIAAPVHYAPTVAATYATAPVVAAPAAAFPAAAIPAPAVSSQFHSQDEFGNVAHGYSDLNSVKHEQGNAHLGVTGSYSYVDPNGQLQTTNYIADALGFRVQATNLPVAPAAPAVPEVELPVAPVYTGKAPVFDLVGPSPVVDTPEVAAAKAEFQAKFDEVANREKRSTPAATEPLVPAPAPLAVAPFGYAGAYAGAYAPFAGAYHHAGYAPYGLPAHGPIAYTAAPALPAPAPVATVVPSAPSAREAVLTKVHLTPGHAVAYRVD